MIIHGLRKYKFGIQRYGGETVVGTITPYQYHYWKARESELTDYLMGFDKQEYEKEHNLPQEARFERDWFENDNVAHINGATIESANFLHIEEFDQHGTAIKDANGQNVYREHIELKYKNIHKLGIECVESEDCVDVDHPSLVNQYYLYAYTTNKGGWTTEKMIEIDGELDLKKLKLHYRQIEGSDICHAISYADGKPIHLEEDSTGSSQECRVMEGYMDEKSMSKKLKKEIARAEAKAPQPDTDEGTADETEDGWLGDDIELPEKSPHKTDWKNKKSVLAAVQEDGWELQYADKSLKKDKSIVLAAIKQRGTALEYADKSLKKDKSIVLAAVKSNGLALLIADKSLKKDKSIVLAAVKQNGVALQYADKSLKKDKSVVLAAVQQYGSVINYADKSFRKDKFVVLEAVKSDGSALQFADKSLKKDKSIVLVAIKQNVEAFEFVDESLKSDPDVIKAVKK